MLRVVLAVLVAVALLGVAMPVVEEARDDRTARLLEGELTAVAESAGELATEGELSATAPPRRSLRVDLPADGPGTAPVEYVAVGGVPDCKSPRDTAAGDVVAYRLSGHPPRVSHLPFDLRVPGDGHVRDDDEPLVLAGDATLTLTLVERHGRRTVLAERGRSRSRRDGSEVVRPGRAEA